MCPEAKALSEPLIYNPVSTVSFLYTLEPGYAQKAKANFNLLETGWSCCGFYITFNFSRLIFYSNVFFPQISCRCLSVWRFHFAAVKVPKKRQARDRERKSEERERGRRMYHSLTPHRPRHCASVRTWHAVASSSSSSSGCCLRLQFEFSCLTICRSTTQRDAAREILNDH